MFLSITRSVDPYDSHVDFELTTEDFDKAFAQQADPDEDLFYAWFQPRSTFDALPMSERLVLASRIAKLVEDFDASHAASLNESITIEPKGDPA